MNAPPPEMPRDNCHNDRHWFQAWLKADFSQYDDEHESLSDDELWQMANSNTSNRDSNNRWNIGNYIDLAVENQQVEVTDFSEQMPPSPNYVANRSFAAVPIDCMTVQQRADWITELSVFNGWEEADWYSLSFQENRICGERLRRLTLDSLKWDLGIEKYEHRRKIMAGIERLYHGLLRSEGTSRNSMSELISDIQFGRADADTVQTNKQFNSFSRKDKSTQTNQGFPKFGGSPCRNGEVGFMSCCDAVQADDQNERDQNSIVNKSTITSNPDLSSALTPEKTIKCEKPKVNPAGVLSFSLKKKSLRARPDNPVEYKTLCKTWIRSGKAVRTDNVRCLSKGSVVVINQIKGRSGRVVVPQPDGKFLKIGWVTLYTHDRQQRLERLIY